MESQGRGKARGAFALHLERALERALSHRQALSLHDAVIEAGTTLLKEGLKQCPVAVGPALKTFLFEGRRSSGAPSRGKLVALLVGIDRYRLPGTDLRGCVNDVDAYARLVRRYPGAFGRASVFKLTDAKASADNIRKELQRTLARSRPQDTFLFFFSGHRITEVTKAGAPRFILPAHDFADSGTGTVPEPDIVQALSAGKARSKVMIFG
jgi:hypothetical protein